MRLSLTGTGPRRLRRLLPAENDRNARSAFPQIRQFFVRSLGRGAKIAESSSRFPGQRAEWAVHAHSPVPDGFLWQRLYDSNPIDIIYIRESADRVPPPVIGFDVTEHLPLGSVAALSPRFCGVEGCRCAFQAASPLEVAHLPAQLAENVDIPAHRCSVGRRILRSRPPPACPTGSGWPPSGPAVAPTSRVGSGRRPAGESGVSAGGWA